MASRSPLPTRTLAVALGLALGTTGALLGAPSTVWAQGTAAATAHVGHHGAMTAPATTSSPDFLFRAPGVTFTLRTGVMNYRASGGFFDVTTDVFTARRQDFRGPMLGAEIAASLGPRVDVTAAFDGGFVQVDHESAIYEELDGTPVFQSTRLRTGPALQFGARGYLLPKGEQVSALAWVPNRVAPFVGAGVGWMSWDLRQWGDFGFTTDEGDFILADDLNDSGWSGLAYGSLGTDLLLARSWWLTLEGRYQWASADLAGDFRRLTDRTMDLNGLRLTAGLSVRF